VAGRRDAGHEHLAALGKGAVMKKLPLVAAVALCLAGAAVAEESRATPTDAEDLVKSAVAYLKKNGQEKAFKEFQNKSGPFIYRDLYIFVNNMSGFTVCHGVDPARNGMNVIDAKDADGKLYIRERLELMKAKSVAWQEFKYKNPSTGKVEQKTAYLERVGDLIVGSGAYKP
jgi:cytochrome c